MKSTLIRNTIKGQFAPHTIEMLRSPAWRALSLSARRVIDRLEIELADHGGKDNGRLPCTYADFVQYGIHRHAIAPAIREACALGFLEVARQGRAGNAEFRMPALYRLTFRNTGRAPQTDEWARIGEDEAEHIALCARRSSATKKQNPGAGKRQFSVTETGTEKTMRPVMETITTGPVMETITTLDISGRKGRHIDADARQRGAA